MWHCARVWRHLQVRHGVDARTSDRHKSPRAFDLSGCCADCPVHGMTSLSSSQGLPGQLPKPVTELSAHMLVSYVCEPHCQMGSAAQQQVLSLHCVSVWLGAHQLQGVGEQSLLHSSVDHHIRCEAGAVVDFQ